ncbi:MAG: CbiX/SirB N-terminal domain-containing protein [Prochlorococcaceae cyanobacterium]
MDPAPDPDQLPPPGSAARWPWLQSLRRSRGLPLERWLTAIETGGLEPEADLLASLAPHLDGAALRRLLHWWLALADPAPPLPQLAGPWRDPATAALLRQALDGPLAPDRQGALLPLLGHQRDPADGPRLCRLVMAPLPGAVRRGALEALSLGLAVWPRPPLRRCLEALASDLDPTLAAAAVDLLARLPAARSSLVPLGRRALEPAVAERLRRRLAGRAAEPLLLLVHGRAGGIVPPELETLAEELAARRSAPVTLRALTATTATTPPPPRASPHRASRPLALVPLLLLPGGHVRHDVAPLLADLRRHGSVRRWPCLGAWPAWQAALAAELAGLTTTAGGAPQLLHHPLEGGLAARYLAHLAHRTGAQLLAAPYGAAAGTLAALVGSGPAIPLALASCRLTETLADLAGPTLAQPLLTRPALRGALLDLLEALP